MGETDFSGEMFSVLAEGEKRGHISLEYQFPLWDILKEISRRARRTERDKGKGIREYMSSHADEVERIRKKHGL